MTRPYYAVLAERTDSDASEWVLAWSDEEAQRHVASLREQGYIVHVHEVARRVQA